MHFYLHRCNIAASFVYVEAKVVWHKVFWLDYATRDNLLLILTWLAGDLACPLRLHVRTYVEGPQANDVAVPCYLEYLVWNHLRSCFIDTRFFLASASVFWNMLKFFVFYAVENFPETGTKALYILSINLYSFQYSSVRGKKYKFFRALRRLI